MAKLCKEQQVQVEEEVLQPVDKWVKKQKEKCKEEECNPWLLCLNQVVCWLVWVTVKVVEWVTVVVVRWVYRLVCVVVTLVVGVLALLIGNTDILLTALRDLWELVKDLFYTIVGFAIYVVLSAIDWVQVTFKVEEKRKLTKSEIDVLRKIFGDSILYDAIRVIEGNAGILNASTFNNDGAAFTIGYNIYAPNFNIVTLVHECVHVWQFQFGGTQYIGQSSIYQGLKLLLGGADPYDWESEISDDPNAWYLLDSVEAQAEFVEDVFIDGEFVFDSGSAPDITNGAFFREDNSGQNKYVSSDSGVDYTERANHAWRIIRTG